MHYLRISFLLDPTIFHDTSTPHTDKMKLEQHCIYHYASALWDLHRGHRITRRVNSVKTSARSCQRKKPVSTLTGPHCGAAQRLHKGHPVLTALWLLMDVEPLSLDSTCRLWLPLNDGSVRLHKQPKVNRAGYYQDPLCSRYPWQPGNFVSPNPEMIRALS